MAEKGINKNILAKESGIPYTTIDGWYKKGYDDIRLSTLRKLSAYFNVSIDFLMDNKIESTTETEDQYYEILQVLKDRPAAHMLFHASKTATTEDIIRAAKFLDAMKGDNEEP